MSQVNTQQQVNGVFLPDGSLNSQGTQGTEGAASTGSVTGTQGATVTPLILNAQGQLVNSQPGDDGFPSLPDVAGTQGSGTSAQGAVANWLQMKHGSLSQAVGVLSDLAANNMMTMQQIRTEAGKNEYTTQEQSADQQVAQVQGERQSAWTKFEGALTGAALTVGASFFGGFLGGKGWSGKMAGFASVMSAVSQPITQLSQTSTDLIDKTEGGQFKADQAKIAKAYLDMLVTIFKSEDDGFNSEVQNAQKSLQNVWDLTRSVNDQNNQTIINTNSNV